METFNRKFTEDDVVKVVDPASRFYGREMLITNVAIFTDFMPYFLSDLDVSFKPERFSEEQLVFVRKGETWEERWDRLDAKYEAEEAEYKRKHPIKTWFNSLFA